MYAVVVTLKIEEGQMEQFLPHMMANARASRETEPGCQQFDVCRDGDTLFLYELYDDRAAFEAHMQTAHYQKMDAAAHLIASKELQTYAEVLR
ncbi:putative quinol monooxygenase [Primorskyibacter sp. S187A]|uniref:putative quinol monooxygenase n=1 Tax=Primorskyibacter sp. S187A TaxID=3415130 RepID=UPI003C7E90E6